MNRYRTIFISDVHLGSKGCKANLLNNFLEHNSAEAIYLIGDIIDGWKVQQNKWLWNKACTKVVRSMLKLSQAGTKITYVTGNHDEFLRPLVGHNFSLGNISLANHVEHRGADGKRYLVVHGDMFDGITRLAPWLSVLGDHAYDFVVWLNTKFNFARHRLGLGYWSLSGFLKRRVKKAVDFMFHFEHNLAAYCKRKGYDGVICGHIHHPEIKQIDGVTYMNDGDWVDSCSALVEHLDGRWEIVLWHKEVR